MLRFKLLLTVVGLSAVASMFGATADPAPGATSPAEGTQELTTSTGSVNNRATLPADKATEYRDVCRELGSLKAQEKDLAAKGYTEAHPLVRVVRAQLGELAAQKANLERAYPGLKNGDITLAESSANSGDGKTPVSTQQVSAERQPAPTALAAAADRKMEALDDKQKLGVGDRVSFRVLEDQEEAKPLTVTDAGELDVPELGLVTAAGKTCKQLAFEIKPKLEQTSYYHATVIISIELLNKTMSGRRAYVSGQVQRTGPQEIPAGEAWTVTKAIMKAGGFTEYADKKHVRVVRAASKGTPAKTVILNVDDVLEKGRTDLDLSVEPEDLIYVPARAVNF